MIYTFKQLNDAGYKKLICPRCCEVLNRIDIEHFSTCPYCLLDMELTDDLEDFLLEPLVNTWMVREQNQQMIKKQMHSIIDL